MNKKPISSRQFYCYYTRKIHGMLAQWHTTVQFPVETHSDALSWWTTTLLPWSSWTHWRDIAGSVPTWECVQAERDRLCTRPSPGMLSNNNWIFFSPMTPACTEPWLEGTGSTRTLRSPTYDWLVPSRTLSPE